MHSVVEAGRELTDDPLALSIAWRQKQLEYTWLRALMGRYEDFWAVTEAALRFALRRLSLHPTEPEIRRLLDAYLSLACFPEVRSALERLGSRPRAILSNGSPKMLEAAVASSGLGPKALGIPAGELLFVSSNAWDVSGAKAAGYQVVWCNRTGAPEEELGFRADIVITRLDQLSTGFARAILP